LRKLPYAARAGDKFFRRGESFAGFLQGLEIFSGFYGKET
jgi:hypothetical protein